MSRADRILESSRYETILQKSRRGLNQRLAFSLRQANGDAHGTYTLTGEVLEGTEGFQLAVKGEIPAMLPSYPKTAQGMSDAVAALEKRTAYKVTDEEKADLMSLFTAEEPKK